MNGVPTFGEYIRQRRTIANLTRPQLAWLANLSVPYLTKIEGGATPSRHVIESLSTALKLQPGEYEYALILADGPAPRIEPDAPTAGDLEYLDLLNPKPGAYVSSTLDVLAVNTAYAQVFPQLEPGANILEWMVLNPLARTVLVDWMRETQATVGWFRTQIARSGEEERCQEIIDACMRSPEFPLMWRSDSVLIDRNHATLVRDPQTLTITELRILVWHTSASLGSWSLLLATTPDQPTAVTRPVVRERPAMSSPVNTLDNPQRRRRETLPPGDPTPTKPLQQIDGKQLRE
ncbi:helix-turn-helix domain-containing protein [Nocardia crassostreae]|uniref:helix-turn-helix domain-containing protein n=1 Tax=Nocardia crassostreae TaxID=53428 RepID=UPI0008348C05|nr:helix-turn-helix domain-containing protein [Nocardia crassostreae]